MIEIRPSDVVLGVADVLRKTSQAAGYISRDLYEADRVSQVNRMLAYLEQSYQKYNEGLPRKAFDVRSEAGMPDYGQPVSVQKSFEQASLADIEADEQKFFQSQMDYVTKSVTNKAARKEMIQHLTMKHIQNQGVIAKQWNIASDREARASLESLYDMVMASNEPWEEKVRKISTRVDEMVSVGRMWRVEGDTIKARATQDAQYAFARGRAYEVMQQTGNPVEVEAWLQENAPFLDIEKRLQLTEEIWKRWAWLKDKENKMLQASAEETELSYMDRIQKGDLPDWSEVRDSVLPRERKEHYRNLINRITEDAKKAEETRLKAQKEELDKIAKEVEEKRRSAAYFKAYSEIVDWPMNQEEKVEDRILADPLLENKEKEHLIDEYRQRNREAEAAAKKKSPLEVTDESVLAELIRMFYDGDISNDTIKTFIWTKHCMGLSNADSKTWLDKLAQRQPYQVHKLAVDMVKQYYDDLLKEETAEAKILDSRKTEALIIKQIADEAAKGKLTEDGLLQFATNLLVAPKRQKVNGLFSRMETETEFQQRTTPEVKAPTSAEAYDQEMIDRYTAWKGAPPAATSDSFQGAYLETAFFDGQWWYVNRRGSWYRWENGRWRMLTK